MSTPRITALYGALLAAISLWLSIRVALARWRAAEYFGNSEKGMARQIRVHANFTENVPSALLLMAFTEVMGTPSPLIHSLGATLLAARLLHADGVAQDPEPIWFRVVGYTLTCGVIGF